MAVLKTRWVSSWGITVLTHEAFTSSGVISAKSVRIWATASPPTFSRVPGPSAS